MKASRAVAGAAAGAASQHRPIGVGIIGLGVMGRQHLASYRAAHAAGLPNQLVAVADPDPLRRAGQVGAQGNLELRDEHAPPARAFDPALVRAYASAEELIGDREVELVSVCSWTPAHVEHAAAALAAGKHVLVEKPVALEAAQATRLAALARAADTLCMPAMCMRFWPAWSWLQRAIASRRYGAVRSAVFTRVGSHPGPASPFYGDVARSGGALFDLHVHDADFVRFCFGPPSEVVSTGSVNHLTTLYRFEDAAFGAPVAPVAPGAPGASGASPASAALLPGAHVVAEGGWSFDASQPFRMRYTVCFEHATADWDLSRDPALMLARAGRHEPVMLAPGTGYDWEVRHLLAAIARGSRTLIADMADAAALTAQLQAEAESLATGRPVAVCG